MSHSNKRMNIEYCVETVFTLEMKKKTLAVDVFCLYCLLSGYVHRVTQYLTCILEIMRPVWLINKENKHRKAEKMLSW